MTRRTGRTRRMGRTWGTKWPRSSSRRTRWTGRTRRTRRKGTKRKLRTRKFTKDGSGGRERFSSFPMTDYSLVLEYHIRFMIRKPR